MNKKQIERMNSINEILNEISKTDRHFFLNECFVPYGKTSIRYQMMFRSERVTVPAKEISYHGSALNGLLKLMHLYIMTGAKANSLNARHWVYSDENVEALTRFAQEKGFLLKKDESDIQILRICEKLKVEPNEIFKLKTMGGRYVILNNDPVTGSGLFYLHEDKDILESCSMTPYDLLEEVRKGKTEIHRLPKYELDQQKKDSFFDFMVENFHFEDGTARTLLRNILDVLFQLNGPGDLLLQLLDGIGITEEELYQHYLKRINVFGLNDEEVLERNQENG